LKRKTLLLSALLILAFSQVVAAGTLTYSGQFGLDEDVVLIPLLISGNTLVTIQTTSFASGITGFEPVLTVFDGAGNLLLQDATGGTEPNACGARLTDPASGFCLDAYIQATLGTGSYTVALSEWDNIPGGTLADGFPQTGNGNFTGPEFLGQPGAFILFNTSQRTNNWALQIDGAASTPTPEPGTAGLLGTALAGAVMLRRRFCR
jgi:hypothetical protein